MSFTIDQLTAIGFNPRPALEPGATPCCLCGAHEPSVSILARLWSRALPCRCSHSIRNFYVSILARLWSRALQYVAHRLAFLYMFQSSPGFGAGRYMSGVQDFSTKRNVSILARLWSRALLTHIACSAAYRNVSILARLWSRALLGNHIQGGCLDMFQSSPGFGAGRYID